MFLKFIFDALNFLMMKKIVLLFLFTGLQVFSQNKKKEILIPFRDKKQWGLSDTLGKIKVKPFADEISQFSVGRNGAKYVIRKQGKLSVVDQNLNVLLAENNYDSCTVSGNHDELAVFKNGKMGIVKNKKEIVAPKYSKVKIAANSSYIVSEDDVEGLINANGEMIIPMEYKDISQSWKEEDEGNAKFVWMAEGMLTKKKFYDEKIKVSYDQVGPPIGVMQSSRSYTTEDMRKTELQIKEIGNYDHVKTYAGATFAYVIKNNKHGVVAVEKRKEIIAPLYDEELDYANEDKGKSAFIGKKNGKSGIITEDNKIIVPFEYDSIERNYGNFYLISKNNRYGIFIFNTIYPLIPAKYAAIKEEDPIQVNDRWQFGIFKVKTIKGTSGYIGENGVEYFKD